MLRVDDGSEPSPQRLQAVADTSKGVRVQRFPKSELELLGAPSRLGEQALLGALQRKALVVEKGLDPAHEIEIAPTVEPLPGRILLGPEQLELRLPVPEDVRGNARQRFHLADPVIELFGRLQRHAGSWLLIRCLSPLLGLNVNTLRAVISMLSPVCGFRPR